MYYGMYHYTHITNTVKINHISNIQQTQRNSYITIIPMRGAMIDYIILCYAMYYAVIV